MEENKEVVEETTQQPVDETTEQTNEESTDSHISYNEDGDLKVDLNKFNESNDADTEQETTEVATDQQTEAVQEVVEEVPSEQTTVSDEESGTDEQAEEQVETEEEYVDLPENIQKLMDFMEETGGDLNDYVRLNTDIKDLDDSEVLHDYYKRTKPHLSNEEINFLLEDRFSYDEENDEDRDIKRKKLALKEQVAEARAYLDGQKSKYYEEIKAGSKLTSEQQKAIDFFNRYNQEEEQRVKTVQDQQSAFLNKTNQVFNKNFDGFEFNVGDKKIKYNIQNIDDVKNTQVDINNFVGKFLNDQSVMEDAAGYHKGLFTAMNPDAIAKHFYEQGKSDAIKQTVAESKNINTSRESHKVYEGEGGIKFKVLGDDANDMKLRIKKQK